MTSKPDFDKLYEIAEDQAGYFTTAQAESIGYSGERLSNTVKSGKFQRAASGVYRLTYFPASAHEDLFIAWLVTGSHSVISHESALAVYELSDMLPGAVHVIVPRTASRRRKNIRLHTNRLEPDEITTRIGLPITTVARTIADVASSGIASELVVQAVQEALRRGLVSEAGLRRQVERRHGRAKRMIQDYFNRENNG
jgi:predicted transcriptional regulator of viral defense system